MALVRKIIRLSLLVFSTLFFMILVLFVLMIFNIINRLAFIDHLVLPISIIFMVLIVVNAFFPKTKRMKDQNRQRKIDKKQQKAANHK